MAEGDGVAAGMDAYWLGIRLSWFALILMGVYVVSAGTRRAADAGVPMRLPRGTGDEALLLFLVALFLFLLTAAVLSVFLYLTLHGGTVLLDSGVGTAPLQFPAIPDAGTADLLVVVPPLVLLWAGYRAATNEGDPVTATLGVVFGYGFAALLGIVPAAWLFNEFVAAYLGDFLGGTPADPGDLPRIVYPHLVVLHLKVAVVYPLLFGGAGALLGTAFGEPRGVGGAAEGF